MNPLADDTYGDLLAELADRKFAGISPALRRAIVEHYAGGGASGVALRMRDRKLARHLAALEMTDPN